MDADTALACHPQPHRIGVPHGGRDEPQHPAFADWEDEVRDLLAALHAFVVASGR
jgi:hypothetical protein